jgi:Icc-related predicted phosphoesterase
MLRTIISKFFPKNWIFKIVSKDQLKEKNIVRIAIISDTHNYHEKLIIPTVDIIICAGDFTDSGTEKEATNFLEWFNSLKAKYKITILGNHEYCLQKNIRDILSKFPNIIFLDNDVIELFGLVIYGTEGFEPIQYTNKNIDILITHYPPVNILDQNAILYNCGLDNINKFIKDKNIGVHIFGHIHESAGSIKINKTLFINAAIMKKSFIAENEKVELNDIVLLDIK